MDQLIRKIQDKSAIIGIVGLGYVGLPLALAFARKFRVTGFDINKKTVRNLAEGRSHIIDIPDGRLRDTLWLLIKGGRNVGQHLGLLRSYYPGYSVTWTGALVGFFYGALTGAILGCCVAWLYNVLASRRAGSR